ncbi:hypothetical protein [Pseudomonas sp. LT1P18]|uniref:hypothetical protein n=1 Tax=Pseudomonas arabinosi TaxID=3398357 RepID=UPI0039EE3ABA
MILRIITQIWDGPIYGNSILDSFPISAAQAGKNVHANTMTWGFPGIDRRLLKVQFSFLLMVLGGRCNQLAVAWWDLQKTGSALYFASMIACSIAAEVLAKPV